jgi:hypothetical protein
MQVINALGIEEVETGLAIFITIGKILVNPPVEIKISYQFGSLIVIR